MATPVAPADESASSSRETVVAALQPAHTVFQIGARLSVQLGIALAMVLAMLFGTAGEPAPTPQALAVAAFGGQSQLPAEDDHVTGRVRTPLGGQDLVAEAESRDELEERADAPPACILSNAAGEPAPIAETGFGSSRRSVGSQLGRSLGLGRGPPARV